MELVVNISLPPKTQSSNRPCIHCSESFKLRDQCSFVQDSFHVELRNSPRGLTALAIGDDDCAHLRPFIPYLAAESKCALFCLVLLFLLFKLRVRPLESETKIAPNPGAHRGLSQGGEISRIGVVRAPAAIIKFSEIPSVLLGIP